MTNAPATPAPLADLHAKPAPWVLPTHIVAISLMQGMWLAGAAIVPILARKQFGATDFQTLIITSAPVVCYVLSIFWNDLFSRISLRRYLAVYFLIACAPFAFIAFAHNYWLLVIPYLVACVGGAGYHPVAGELLKALYPDHQRSRAYSIVWGIQMLSYAAASFGIGEWLTAKPTAFQIIFPTITAAQLLGVITFLVLWQATGHAANRVLRNDGQRTLRQLLDPILHMRTVLKADPVFLRYEGAFMTYGVGWMICTALLPIIVTTQLNLHYDQIAVSTQVAYIVALVAALIPMGMLMDRIGAIRGVGISFFLLTLHPLGLMWAATSHQLLIVSIVYGIAHAGANLGWMLGPVSLAPSKDKVAQYVSIHATLVGVRGSIFQGLGVLLYTLTGHTLIPLAIAAAAYIWSAIQMWRLHHYMKTARPAVRPG